MNVLKKLTKKVENSKIVKNPKFLVIGLLLIIFLITLIYFIFLKYSPVMNFKYEGYAISGKQVTENLLGASEGNGAGEDANDNNKANSSNSEKNIELSKIEEQGTIFKKLNSYFIGNKEKTEIDLNYPIYINDKNTIYNLSQDMLLISKNFEQVAGYPNLSVTDGKVYDGNNLERADGKEYIFAQNKEGIHINLKEIKINTIANEYVIPANSLIAFEKGYIRYYSVSNNILVFNEIKDVDYNSQITIKNIESRGENNKDGQMVDNTYNYEELLTKLGIIENAKNDVEKEEVIKEDTSEKQKENDKEEPTTPEKEEGKKEEENTSGYKKPEVTVEDFKAEVYSAKSTLHIKDEAKRIVEAPTFEVYKEEKIYLRRIFKSSGEIQITGLVPETEYEIIGKYIYLNEENKKIENTFYKGTIRTKGYEELGTIELSKEEGEIYSNKIRIKNVKITSDLNAEVIKGINQIELETGNIRTVLKNNQVSELLAGKEVTIESSEGLKSNTKIEYEIKFYDKNGKELKVSNNKGKTRTARQKPTARITTKSQDIVSVTLGIKLTNKDNVDLENYKYIITKPNGEKLKEEKLAKNENEIKLEDLDQNQYYKIIIYADYDLGDNKGIQKETEIGNLVFATKPISTLGSLELTVENKELTSKNAKITYKINEEKTDKRLMQILNELTIKIVEEPVDTATGVENKNAENGDNNNKEPDNTENNSKQRKTQKDKRQETIIYTHTLAGEEIKKLQQGETKEINYEPLKSNTKYKIEIVGNVQLGNTKEEVPITYTYKEFTTLKIPAKVEIKNQFVTGNLIDLDVRIEDINKSVLNNKVRMELRDEKSNLIDLQEIETNKDYVRKTYEKLEENKTYKLNFYADQYNEGSTDETYKVNYLIKEIEIVTEPGISGEIGLRNLKRKGTGKNLVDVTSKINWRGSYFNVYNNYGKEYNEETNELKLYCKGDGGQVQKYLYDLSEYAGQTVTMSFKIKKDPKAQIYISNKNSYLKNITDQINGNWQEYEYTTTLDEYGLLGFYVNSLNDEEAWMYLRDFQIELGEKKTKYEKFSYNLEASIKAEIVDKRNETEKYYIEKYENEELVEEKEYSKENIVDENFKVKSNSKYKFNLVIKRNNRKYIVDSQEFTTENDKEIKGINSRQEYIETINPEGNYIVFCDLDVRDLKPDEAYAYRFGGKSYGFNGKIDFNGHKIIRDSSSHEPLFLTTEADAILENFVFEVHLDNEVELKNYKGLFDTNVGKIKNFKVILEEATNKANGDIGLLGRVNYGTIENFIIEAKTNLYGFQFISLGVQINIGTIKNGYAYGKNIKAIYPYTNKNNRDVAVVNVQNVGNVENIFSLINVDVENNINSYNLAGNIIGYAQAANNNNLYSVGYGKNVTNGPTIYSIDSNTKYENIYYFADKIFNNSYNQKNTPLALWDKTFQNQILNSENAFNVEELVEQGYYPQLKWPNCMPKQVYIKLPKVEDKDLADILSTEILESTNNSAKVKFSVNNPSAETITNIKIKNLECKIESQEYKDGKSEVIAILSNPIICVSKYEVISISTKGAYNQEYTRKFKEKERIINISFYKEINTTEDWKNINKSLTENYILMQDLDFKNNPDDVNIWNKLDGIIDGNNHTVKNVTSKTASHIFGNIVNEIKNINFENISLENVSSWGAIIYTAGKANNVHANNIKIINTRGNPINTTHGGLFTVTSGEIKNCGINNVTIISNAGYSARTRIGGLIAVANSSVIENCFATNVNIQSKNTKYEGVGGLIGASETKSTIKNCYTTGKIEIEGENVGGIIGYITNYGELLNNYSCVNISGNTYNIGGIVGSASVSTNIKNNISFGNLYTNRLNTEPRRVIGNGISTNTNYAYSNQRLNGIIQDATETNVKLLTPEDILTQATYTNKLNYGDAYNYSQLGKNILPKLHKINEDETYSKELLPNQEDIYLDISNEFKIENVEIEKSAVDQIAGQIIIINTKEAEIIELEIDGMNVELENIINKEGKTYINITAKPSKFYDAYKITKIKYKENGKQKEQDIEGKIQIQFFKELYNFEDWQSIESGTYQNYKLMKDIDFSGKKNINANVTMARLEAVGGMKTLKNIDLTFNESGNGLIKDINTKLSDVRFENITITNNASGSNLGIIVQNNSDLNNLEFSQIEVNASKIKYVGCISNNTGNISNVNLYDIRIHGGTYTGGFIGSTTETEIIDININNFTISGYDNTGGLFGAVTEVNRSTNIGNMQANEGKITGNNFVGGIAGRGSGCKYTVTNLEVKGNIAVGGLIGIKDTNYNISNNSYIGENLRVIGTGERIGGLFGQSGFIENSYIKNSYIEVNNVNSNYIGGMVGYLNQHSTNNHIDNIEINSVAKNIGGFAGAIGDTARCRNLSIANSKIKGTENIGGIIGKQSASELSRNYAEVEVTGTKNVGGMVGKLDNSNMTAVANTTYIYHNYVANSDITGDKNVGGIIGTTETDLYMPDTFYYSNYVEADLSSTDLHSISLGIGGRQNQNQYLKDTYYYKYSTINGQNPNEQNEVFISSDKYLIEKELKEQTTYTSKLKWNSNAWDFTSLEKNKYPLIKNLTNQDGIDIPKDSEHIVGRIGSTENFEDSIDTQSVENKEHLEQTFEYNEKEIQTYSTYSVITSSDGNNVTRNAKLYVKDNNLYATPIVLSSDNEIEVIPVANNIILDTYNGKEYETVLGSDGKIYDLKEPLNYPKNFINKDIKSIGNNLNSDVKEVEITYKNGDKVRFNYQTGEVISSIKEKSNKASLSDYVKEKIAEIGSSNSDVSQKIGKKYEKSKELQTKLEVTSVEEAIKKQNNSSSNVINSNESITVTENNEANNSLKEKKYISMYNETTRKYEIYNEEELLDTNKEEAISENEKIEANNLNEYYASEGETRNTKMGIVWIVLSIIEVGIILFVLWIRGHSSKSL